MRPAAARRRGNTPRDPKVLYAGLVTACFDAAPLAVDAAFGPRGRIVLNTGSATAPVRATPLALLMGGLAQLRRPHRRSPCVASVRRRSSTPAGRRCASRR
jgi:hypothetical protein